MVQGTTPGSFDNLIVFLDFAGVKGLMKPDTAKDYKRACTTVLAILDDAEKADLSTIDLNNVFTRHSNLAATKITPVTLKSYQSRTRAAVKSFMDYRKDPASWGSGSRLRGTRKPKETRAAPAGKSEDTPPHVSPPTGEVGHKPTHPSIHIDFQIHISPETTPEQIDQVFASLKRYFS